MSGGIVAASTRARALFRDGARVIAVPIVAIVAGDPIAHVVARVGVPASCLAECVLGFIGVAHGDGTVPPGADGLPVREVAALGRDAFGRAGANACVYSDLRELAEVLAEEAA